MTLYVGEQLRIVFTGKEYGNREPLTDSNVNSATVLILNQNSTVLVAEATMAWDPTEAHWEYKWDTAGLAAGTYKYRITVVGADGKPSVEWGRVRLSRQPSIIS